MLIPWLCSIFIVISVAFAVNKSCDLQNVLSSTENLRYDAHSLIQCQHLLGQLSHCSPEEETVRELANQLHYRSGLIQLSLNQDIKAISSFEHITNGENSSYKTLARERLKKLYYEFGLWDKLPSADEKEQLLKLNKTCHSKWEKHDTSFKDNELKELLRISPYSYDVRSLYVETLFWELSKNERIDVNIAHEIINNFEILLDKHISVLSLDTRLVIHHTISVLQMFVINTEPKHLRKCLAIDMDYEPCKTLTLLHNKLSKVNPGRPEILDPDVYAFQSSEMNWAKFTEFYLQSKKPCTRVPKGTKFESNYELVLQFINNSIAQLFKKYHSPPLQDKTEFQKFVDVAICQSAVYLRKEKGTLLPFCEKSLAEIVDNETLNNLQKNTVSDEELLKVWNNYPHMAIYIVQTLLAKSKKISTSTQDQIQKFFQDQHLPTSKNKYIQHHFGLINKLVQERRQKQQQQQQQQQQQHWFFNQQQQRQQYQPPPPTNGMNAEKDYYKILGVSQDADYKEIRKAYLSFTKKYHPDKQGQLSEKEQELIHDKMSEINEAYETLSDDDRRKEYNDVRSGSRNRPINPNMFRQQRRPAKPNNPPFGFKTNFNFHF